MYGVGFVVEEVALLLKPRELGAEREEEGGALTTSLSAEDLDAWLTARLGSVTGQVMSSSKVGKWVGWGETRDERGERGEERRKDLGKSKSNKQKAVNTRPALSPTGWF